MTLLVASDLHLGAGASLGNRLADQESSWVRFCTAAADLRATVLWGGDSHHHRRPTPAEIAAWQSGLRILREADCELIGIPGNHCISSADAPSTIEVASAGFECHIARAPIVIETADGPVGLLPWMPPRLNARDTAEALMIVAESLAEQGAKILVGHWALAGGSLPNGLPLLELSEPMLDPYRLAELFDLVLCGHIHKRQCVVPGVWHIGPLSRGNFGEASTETGAWQIDGLSLADSESDADWWFDIPDRAFAVIEADARGLTDSGATAQVCEAIGVRDLEGAIVRVSWQQTADQQVDQERIRQQLEASEVHYVDALTPIIERQASVRSLGVTEHTSPHESWDSYFAPQAEALGADLAVHVAAAAHRWIEAAA